MKFNNNKKWINRRKTRMKSKSKRRQSKNKNNSRHKAAREAKKLITENKK